MCRFLICLGSSGVCSYVPSVSQPCLCRFLLCLGSVWLNLFCFGLNLARSPLCLGLVCVDSCRVWASFVRVSFVFVCVWPCLCRFLLMFWAWLCRFLWCLALVRVHSLCGGPSLCRFLCRFVVCLGSFLPNFFCFGPWLARFLLRLGLVCGFLLCLGLVCAGSCCVRALLVWISFVCLGLVCVFYVLGRGCVDFYCVRAWFCVDALFDGPCVFRFLLCLGRVCAGPTFHPSKEGHHCQAIERSHDATLQKR